MKTLIFWLPRGIAILIAIFLMMFSFDVFEVQAPLWKKIGGFIIHTLPTFLIIFFVLIAWKKPLIAFILFILFFVLITLFLKTYNRLDSFLLISLPTFIIALLYYLEFYYHQKKVKSENQ